MNLAIRSRPLLACLLCLATVATAQSAPPDTLSEVRPVLPTIEPSRLPRRIDGQHRLVSLRYAVGTEGVDHFSASLPELVKFMDSEVHLTDTRFVNEEQTLGSFTFDDALLLMLTGNRAAPHMSDGQKRLLGNYLKRGGFLFAEDVRSQATWNSAFDVARSGTPFDRMLKTLMADPLVLGVNGRAWRPVPKSHALFRSFFQFHDGPPLSGTVGGRSAVARVQELEMLEYRGRVAVVFSDLNISFAWSVSEAVGRRRALQFGANLVIFALAQYAAGGDPAGGVRPE